MTQPMAPRPGPRRAPAASLMAGVLIALIADAALLGTLPSALAGTRQIPSSQPSSRVTVTVPEVGRSSTPSWTPSRKQSAKASIAPHTQIPTTSTITRGLVMVSASSADTISSGTGMILTSDGFVLTNYHVVRSSTSVSVTVASNHRSYAATLVGRDATKDVALLKLTDASGLSTITIDQDPVAVNDTVVAAGNAAGQGYITAFSGNVVATNQSILVSGSSTSDPQENLTGLIETDAHAEPGDSGGPLFDADYEVEGMTTAGGKAVGSQTITTAFAVPIADALAVVNKVRSGEESGTVVIGPKPYLGVVVEPTVVRASGIRLTQVEAGSPAAKVGLAPGDSINSLNGRTIDSRATLASTLDAIQPGATVSISWRTSAGVERTANVTLVASHIN